MCVHKNANCSPLTGGAGEAGVAGVAWRNASPTPNSRFRGICADPQVQGQDRREGGAKDQINEATPWCEVSAAQITELLWIIKSAHHCRHGHTEAPAHLPHVPQRTVEHLKMLTQSVQKDVVQLVSFG